MTNEILHGLYTDEFMASHTVSESKGSKTALPQAQVMAIIGIILQFCYYEGILL
jgi:BEN domain